MELKERIDVLKQGAELAQKKGALSLKEAYYAKLAIDALNSNTSVKDALDILVKVAIVGQKAGAYSLNDAALLHLASDNIESVLQVSQPVPTTATPVEKTGKSKKERD